MHAGCKREGEEAKEPGERNRPTARQIPEQARDLPLPDSLPSHTLDLLPSWFSFPPLLL